MTTPIPQPAGYPYLGNIFDFDPKDLGSSVGRLAQQHGEIFKISTFGNERYFLCSERLVREVCDESRFSKVVALNLLQVRNGVGDGLFTADSDSHNWVVAHRALTPAFGPIAIQNMYDEMYDIATQLVSKWARLEPDQAINVTDDYTRLALDSIALCAMDKRFNSFYQEEMHPFVHAMTDFLIESGLRSRKTRLELLLNQGPNRKYEQNIALMRSVAEEVIERRRRNPVEKKDLLNAMLYGQDPKTKERLTDESIMNNMLTFLIAGHETTSGLLSYTTYYLLKNPAAMQRAQAEVDAVVGRGPVKFEHISKLPYIEAVLREALRLSPPAPAIGIQPRPGTKEPVLLGGEYLVPADATLICWLPLAQRDPAVFGDDAEEFKPERMLDETFSKLPKGAWKPFGNGARGCIGRPFAWQEAVLALSLILQNFNLRLADPYYQLRVKNTLTVKPDGFQIKVALRPGINPLLIEQNMFGGKDASAQQSNSIANIPQTDSGKPMTILYGSNSGTCDGLAQKLALAANGKGFAAAVKSLDEAIDAFPKDRPVVMISASYEGLPPDNATLFVEWLKKAPNSMFEGSRFAVFGCGHSDWVSTYQRIPIVLDETLATKGATSILARGETNVAKGTIFDDFDAWADKLWSALGSKSSTEDEGLDMELSSTSRATHLRYSVQDAMVLKNECLTPKGITPEKHFIEFKLPTTASYETGDYLALLPINDFSVVSRVLRRFALPWDATMRLKKGCHSTIPTEVDLSVSVVLASYVELNTPATKKNIETLAKYLDKSFTDLDNKSSTRLSPLDILEAHPDLDIPFSVYLSMLPAMRIRQYSISSSPLADPTIASITFSLADDADEPGAHPGVATHYLKKLHPGSVAQIAIRKSPAPFHPPSDPSVPMLMMCAGTGIAPFRGFVQDRAAKLSTSRTPSEFAPAVLIIGCRDPEIDALHATELKKWEAEGAVKVYYAYSRASDKSAGCKYAQDRLWHERKECTELFDKGAKVYICGSGKLGKGIADVVAKISVEWRKEHGTGKDTEQESREWWESLRNERYAVDVFD